MSLPGKFPPRLVDNRVCSPSAANIVATAIKKGGTNLKRKDYFSFFQYILINQLFCTLEVVKVLEIQYLMEAKISIKF